MSTSVAADRLMPRSTEGASTRPVSSSTGEHPSTADPPSWQRTLGRLATYSATESIWAPCSSVNVAVDCRTLKTPTMSSSRATTTS